MKKRFLHLFSLMLAALMLGGLLWRAVQLAAQDSRVK